MKLLNCQQCHDIIEMHLSHRYCRCQKSGGRVLDDHKTLEYHGPARILGISNEEYRNSLTIEDYTHTFKWFQVPPSSPSLKKLDNFDPVGLFMEKIKQK